MSMHIMIVTVFETAADADDPRIDHRIITMDHFRRITLVGDAPGEHFTKLEASSCLPQKQRSAVRRHLAAIKTGVNIKPANW